VCVSGSREEEKGGRERLPAKGKEFYFYSPSLNFTHTVSGYSHPYPYKIMLTRVVADYNFGTLLAPQGKSNIRDITLSFAEEMRFIPDHA
jgi:hypothetical protein